MPLFGQNTVLKVMHLILTLVSDISSCDINKTSLLCVHFDATVICCIEICIW